MGKGSGSGFRGSLKGSPRVRLMVPAGVRFEGSTHLCGGAVFRGAF